MPAPVRNRRRWAVRLIVVLAAGVGVLAWAIWGRTLRVSVENRSGQRIVQLEITLRGKVSAFANVPPGATVAADAGAGQDTLRIEGQLADGTHARFSGPTTAPLRFAILPGGQVHPAPEGK